VNSASQMMVSVSVYVRNACEIYTDFTPTFFTDIYKKEFVDEYAKIVSKAKDLDFAIVLEPDSLGNAITNQGVPFCANATPVYEEGIAYAISKLQYPNVHLYIDAAHGGWLGWADNLKPTAQIFAKVVAMAQKLNPTAKIRGYSTNVSNYNPFNAKVRENYVRNFHVRTACEIY
jgi:cellulose 1,4-beta-cellobiosidase